MTTTDLDDSLQRATLEVERLRSIIPNAKLYEMLRKRYAPEVLEKLFPQEVASDTREPPAKVAIAPSTRTRATDRQTLLLPSQPKPIAELLSAAVPDEPVPIAGLVHLPADTEELGFQYVPLIQCTLPHSDPEGATTYTRRNGRLELTVATSTPTVGLPYGVPARLLAIYTATEVVRSRSREIFLGRTVTEFLRKLHVPVSSGRRGTIGVYLDQLHRLVHSVFTIQESIADGAGRRGLQIRKVLFADEACLWSDADGLRGSSIHLSEPLFESMLERSAPLSMDAVRALRRSPLDLDVYAWLVYRLYHLNRRLVIPWNELALQFGQAYSRERDFRTFFRQSLTRVLKEYPGARVEPTKDGLCLLPSRPHIVPSAPRK